MANITRALLATIQRVRDTYQLLDPDNQNTVAIPPTWINSAPLLQHLQDKNQWTPQEQVKNDYELSCFANAIVTNRHVWSDDGDSLWSVYEQVLNSVNSDITESMLLPWQNARNGLEMAYLTSLEGIDYPTTVLDENPNWKRVDISENQLEQLCNKAMADSTFASIYETLQGGDLEEQLSIKKVSFEMASVRIDRPWLKKDLLENRQWRLRNGATINGKNYLSSTDDSDAFRGALPGYPTAFIMVRNFSMVFETSTEQQEEKVQEHLDNGNQLNFGPLMLYGNLSPIVGGSKNQYSINGLNANTKTINQIKLPYLLNTLPAGKKNIGNSYEEIFNAANKPLLRNLQPSVQFTGGTPKPVFKPGGFPIRMGRGTGTPTLIPVTISVKNKQGNSLSSAQVSMRLVSDDGAATQMAVTNSTGKATLNLKPKSYYQLLVVKTGCQEYRQNFTTPNGGAPTIEASLPVAANSGTEDQDQITDVQLLAVVYHKLGQSPRPMEGFVSVDEVE